MTIRRQLNIYPSRYLGFLTLDELNMYTLSVERYVLRQLKRSYVE